MQNSNLAPIVLFVYNRPWHTMKTLEALMANDLANQSVIYIYADGPKPDALYETRERINEVRELIHTKKWCKEVHIIESISNKGLANSIIKGLSEIVNRYGKIIVLEDDIVTSIGFLKYMNDALEIYKDEKRVMHVSGYWPNAPFRRKNEKTFLLQFMSCWGWATWKDRWCKLITDTRYLANTLIDKKKDFNLSGTNDFYKQIEENISGRINTWAIKWYASIYLNNGLCLYPYKSLVQNIGFDGSGVHFNGGTLTIYNSEITDYIPIKRIFNIVENKRARRILEQFYFRMNHGTLVFRLKKLILFLIRNTKR